MSIETTYTAARANLAKLLDSAVEDREIVLIRRRSGDDVALVAADELESLLESAHLLRPRATRSGCSLRFSGRVRVRKRRAVWKSFGRRSGLIRKADERRQREAVSHPEFREDLRYWVDTDRKLALR